MAKAEKPRFQTMVELLADATWRSRIRMPLSARAAGLLLDLTQGTKLTGAVMQKRGRAVMELVLVGVIRLDIKRRADGVTPGKIIRHAIEELVADLRPMMKDWNAR